MKHLAAVVRTFIENEDGAALVEYGMLVFLIALLCIVALKSLGQKVSTSFETANSQLP